MAGARDLIVGVILAGGRAERMGGGDKCLRPFGGSTLLDHAIRRLKPQVDALVLSANGDARRFGAFALPVVDDGALANQGPLAGILAAMRWAIATLPAADFMASVPSDAPFFPPDLVEQLRGAAAPAPAIRIASSRGLAHPVFALWPLALEPRLGEWLAAGRSRSVQAFAEAAGMVAVPFADVAGIDPFFNINSPDDLGLARRFRDDELANIGLAGSPPEAL